MAHRVQRAGAQAALGAPRAARRGPSVFRPRGLLGPPEQRRWCAAARRGLAAHPARTSRLLASRRAAASSPAAAPRTTRPWWGGLARLSTDAAAADAAPKEEREFQAETRQLLDIVTNSLYTDKEVFLRELVSNASDALEKLRHVQATGTLSGGTSDDCEGEEVPLEIRISTDEAAGTLTIADTGIGMTRDEMATNLGTIARSGSKAFVQEMQSQVGAGDGAEDGAEDDDPDPLGQGIIGKFGVGFYSGFMVADQVDVRTRSAGRVGGGAGPGASASDDGALVWESAGAGTYSIAPLAPDVRQGRGTSVVLHLKPELRQYADEKVVEDVLKKYSNFVGFPIYLNGNRVNTLDAVWLQDPKSVDDGKHAAFYKYVSGMYDAPLSTLHFRADAPLDIKALFYVPSFHQEKHGMGRMEPGVSLYSRKVLIEAKSPDILPEWCRFVRGCVDSEDLPLSISREKPQDTALMAKMKKALTGKLLQHLSKMMKKDPDKYKDEFYKEYAFFLKEGVCQDFESQQKLSKLLYFETSRGMGGELVSLDEYVSRCPPEQKDIFYLFAPSREMALQSPYMEQFTSSKREVIFIYSAIDDFVMANLKEFEGRKLVSADKSEVDVPQSDGDKDKADKADDASASAPNKLSLSEAAAFCSWFQSTLASKVSRCTTSARLTSSPAIVTDSESGAMRRMMRMVETQSGGIAQGSMPLPKQTVEINPNHEIIAGINELKEADPELAKVLAEQVMDNCLVAAGLLDDGRVMLPRLNDLMLCVVKSSVNKHEVGGKSKDGEKSPQELKNESEQASPEESTDASSMDDQQTKDGKLFKDGEESPKGLDEKKHANPEESKDATSMEDGKEIKDETPTKDMND